MPILQQLDFLFSVVLAKYVEVLPEMGNAPAKDRGINRYRLSDQQSFPCLRNIGLQQT